MSASTNLLTFEGQVVVVTGAASGIGAATASAFVEAGAEVHAVDVAEIAAPVASAYRCDLGDATAVAELVVELPTPIDVLVNCAGVPNGGRFSPYEVMAINWLGLWQLTEQLLSRIPAGGSITHVASTAGRQWELRREALAELVDASDHAAAAAWIDAHPDLVGDGYGFSKEAVQYYTVRRSLETLEARGVRMNSVCPGVTNTALAGDFRRGVGDAVIDRAIDVAGRMAEPAEMAPAVLFLSSLRAASYINGVNLNVDRGTGAAHLVGRF